MRTLIYLLALGALVFLVPLLFAFQEIEAPADRMPSPSSGPTLGPKTGFVPATIEDSAVEPGLAATELAQALNQDTRH